MGTTLTGTQINNTYDGLIKTTDNTAITATTKLISDGLGNDTCIKVGTAGTDFLGNVDFSAATVTGLPGGAAGLESGTGADSMQSAASLTTVAANASGNCSIALGNGALARSIHSVAIGQNADTRTDTFYGSVAIGCGACVQSGNGHVVIGAGRGGAARTLSDQNIIIGNNASGNFSSALSIVMGAGACSTANSGVAIGCGARSNATGAVALGKGVTAAIADTVSIKALEVQTASTPTAGGIIMTDAGSVARRINIDATGALQIDSTPVGGGGGAGLVSGTGTDSIKNADSLVTNPANASGNCSIAIGDAASAGLTGVAIGTSATVTGAGTALGNGADAGGLAISIGDSSSAPGDRSIGMGYTANAAGVGSIALGDGATTTGTCAAIAIGLSSSAGGCSVALGPGAVSPLPWSVAIGRNSIAGSAGISIGNAANSGGSSISIGPGARADGGTSNISMGTCTCARQNFAVSIGLRACTTSTQNIALGSETNACAAEAIHIGGNPQFTNYGVFANGGVVLGSNSCVTAGATCAVALGTGVTASRADTTTSCQLEACVAGKGIVVTSPDGLTTLGIGIDNTGAIVTYTP